MIECDVFDGVCSSLVVFYATECSHDIKIWYSIVVGITLRVLELVIVSCYIKRYPVPCLINIETSLHWYAALWDCTQLLWASNSVLYFQDCGSIFHCDHAMVFAYRARTPWILLQKCQCEKKRKKKNDRFIFTSHRVWKNLCFWSLGPPFSPLFFFFFIVNSCFPSAIPFLNSSSSILYFQWSSCDSLYWSSSCLNGSSSWWAGSTL